MVRGTGHPNTLSALSPPPEELFFHKRVVSGRHLCGSRLRVKNGGAASLERWNRHGGTIRAVRGGFSRSRGRCRVKRHQSSLTGKSFGSHLAMERDPNQVSDGFQACQANTTFDVFCEQRRLLQQLQLQRQQRRPIPKSFLFSLLFVATRDQRPSDTSSCSYLLRFRTTTAAAPPSATATTTMIPQVSPVI